MKPIKASSLRPPLSAAFSLVEVLVASAVLALLITLVAGILNSTRNATSVSGRLIDAQAQARQIFDRMAVDFRQMAKRSDLAYYCKSTVEPQPGNDCIAFPCEAPGYYPLNTGANERPHAALVGYRVIADSLGEPKLNRLAKGATWDASAPILFLPQTLTTKWPGIAGEPPDSDYQVLSDQAFRFEYQYLLKDGQLSDVPVLIGADPEGFRDVLAILVSVALSDKEARVRGEITDAAVGSLADSEPRTTVAAKPSAAASLWETALKSQGFATTANLTGSAAANIRIFSRMFYLGSTN